VIDNDPMGTLFRILVVLLLLLAAAAAVLRDSAYWSFVELHHGLQQRDVARVEAVVDLERFAASTTRLVGAVASEGLAGSDLQGRLIGAFVDVLARGVGEVVKADAAQGLRKAIAAGDVPRGLGPFVVADGFGALGALTTTPTGAIVELRGACEQTPATLAFVLERRDDGFLAGRPRRYVITGVEPASAKALLAMCLGGRADAPS
jgi:hypothetical protein